MKKLLMFIAVALIFATPAMAANDPDPGSGNWLEILQSFAALAVALPLVVDFFKSKFKMQGLPLQILSWAIGIVVSFIAWFLNLGMFAGMIWWHVLAVGIGVSLASNGIADTGLIRAILAIFGINVNKHKV